MAGTIVVYLHM